MADTKFMANKRLTVALGIVSGNPFLNPAAPTVAEMNALKNVSAATRINGYTFGLQASQKTSDRSFADDAAAEVRGFNQFGGDAPFYLPTNFADTSDLLQQTFTLVKTPGVALWLATRLGAVNTTSFAAGDWINVYKVLTDGFQNEIAGNQGGVSMITFLPQGEVYALAQVAPAAPVALVLSNFPTTAAIGKPVWGAVTYQGVNVTADCSYVSSDVTKLVASGDESVFLASVAGSATITVSLPGATSATTAAITIA